MSNTFSLDDIRAAAEKKYGNVVIRISDEFSVTLLNPLRLSDEKRDALMKLQERLDDSTETGESQRELLEEGLSLVAQYDGDKLIEAIGGDLTVLASTFEHYTSGSQAGEA